MFGEFMIEMDEQYLAYRGWYGVVNLPKNDAYSFCHCKWICNSSVPFALSFFVSFVTWFRACDRLNVRVYVAFVGLFVRSLVRSCVHAFLLSCGHASFVCSCVRSCVCLLVCSWIPACVLLLFVNLILGYFSFFLLFLSVSFTGAYFCCSPQKSARNCCHCISTANCDDNKRYFGTYFADKHFWTQGFVMVGRDKLDCVPLFLGEVADDIFVCGKTINLLKLCCPEVCLDCSDSSIIIFDS